MIDMHCHLLPAMDDGSETEQRSLRQLRGMVAGGITDAFLTTHYLKGVYNYDRSLYDEKLNGLRRLALENGLDIGLHQGFEIFLHPSSVEDVARDKLTLGKSRYVLIESDLNGLRPDFYNDVYPLLRKGYRPVLAHAERYVSIMHKPSEAKQLIDQDVYLQVNSGSLVGLYGDKVRQTAWILVRNGWAHLLGSDDHGRSEYGSYFTALELLREDIDNEIVKLLTAEFPLMVMQDQLIPRKYVYIQHSHSRHRSFWSKVFG